MLTKFIVLIGENPFRHMRNKQIVNEWSSQRIAFYCWRRPSVIPLNNNDKMSCDKKMKRWHGWRKLCGNDVDAAKPIWKYVHFNIVNLNLSDLFSENNLTTCVRNLAHIFVNITFSVPHVNDNVLWRDWHLVYTISTLYSSTPTGDTSWEVTITSMR